MHGSGPNTGEFCGECLSGPGLPRYAGLLAQCSDELVRAVRRGMGRADAAALDERWRAVLSARCHRCGSHLVQQWMAGEKKSIRALADPQDIRRFPVLDFLDPDFLAAADQQTLLDGLVDAALTHSPADMANAQLVDPARRGLYIAAQQGFERPFLDFFDWVADDGSACAAAATRGAITRVPDVARSPVFNDASRQAMLDAGSHAVQSIPLVSSTGQVLGVFSCHYHKVGMPGDGDVRLLSDLTRAAVRSLQWQGRRIGNGRVVASVVHDDASEPSHQVAADIRKIVTEIRHLLDGQG